MSATLRTPAATARLHRVFDRAVAPAALGLVLGGRVLRVVDDEIGAGKELDVTAVLLGQVAGAGGQMPRMRLVIARVDDGDAVRLEPIAERERRMVEILRRDANVADVEDAFHDVVVPDARARAARA